MVISLLYIGMQAVYGVEVKDPTAFLMIYIHNAAFLQTLKNAIAPKTVR